MKVLVLGGTGAMGGYLVQLLAEENTKVVVTSRRRRNSTDHVKYIKGDAKNLNFIKKITRSKWDVIIDFMVYSTPKFKDHVGLLLKATSQYIFLSSARVYAKSETPITEKSPLLLDVSQDKEYLSTDEYALSKARQEKILKRSGKKNWTIIRPYITYSHMRLQLGILEKESWLYRAINGRTIVLSNEIQTKKTTLSYGLDVAKAIKSIIGKPSVLGESFHVTANQNLIWQEVLELYLNVLERKLGYRPNYIVTKIKTYLNKHPKSKHQIVYDRLYDRVFDNSKIKKYIDANSFTSEKGLIDCMEIFLKKPKFKRINWKMEAVYDRICNEYTPLNEIKGFKYKMQYIFYRYLFKPIS